MGGSNIASVKASASRVHNFNNPFLCIGIKSKSRANVFADRIPSNARMESSNEPYKLFFSIYKFSFKNTTYSSNFYVLLSIKSVSNASIAVSDRFVLFYPVHANGYRTSEGKEKSSYALNA